jgi:hypothetical protein
MDLKWLVWPYCGFPIVLSMAPQDNVPGHNSLAALV